MPNVKIYVDEAVLRARGPQIRDALAPLREVLCRGFGVTSAQCQLAILSVEGLPDQHAVSAEINILNLPDRTRARITEVGEQIREVLCEAAAMTVAVRLLALDPQTYVTLK